MARKNFREGIQRYKLLLSHAHGAGQLQGAGNTSRHLIQHRCSTAKAVCTLPDPGVVTLLSKALALNQRGCTLWAEVSNIVTPMMSWQPAAGLFTAFFCWMDYNTEAKCVSWFKKKIGIWLANTILVCFGFVLTNCVYWIFIIFVLNLCLFACFFLPFFSFFLSSCSLTAVNTYTESDRVTFQSLKPPKLFYCSAAPL